MTWHRTTLPRRAPARVLACGAWLKNTACLIDGDTLWWSPLHGDLGQVSACEALEQSVAELERLASGPLQAVAHDLHPDFHSTRVAQDLARRRGVPAIGVQHHLAHIAAVQAEQAIEGPVIGLALDGVGLGTDGAAWGGELLWVDAAPQAEAWRRLGHLHPLALPGGDVAAREPWRLAAAALHAAGLADQIVPRFGPVVGEPAARLIVQMLDKQLNCPLSTGAGRWFDAVAGLLGLSVRQTEEAEAAIALERRATAWLDAHPDLAVPWTDLDLRPLVGEWLALGWPRAEPSTALAPPVPVVPATLQAAQDRGAAVFHLALVAGLAAAATQAARAHGATTVVLGGGCFFNRLLTQRLTQALAAEGLAVARPQALSCGDAGLALGQAWVAACTVAAAGSAGSRARSVGAAIDPLHP